jgi:short-subunit dehydrogenase
MTYTLITGASGVLGKAFAVECAKRGENLILTGRSFEKLNLLKDELTAVYPAVNLQVYPCNLALDGDVDSFFDWADKYKISRLICVAGADIQRSFESYDIQKISFQTRACFEGAVKFCSFAIAHRAESLKIINISSVSGLQPMPYFAIYSATKGALTSFSKALSVEMKGKNVNVCAILPGAIYTRDDVKEYIKTQGLWGKIATKTPEYVVKKSLKVADSGKTVYIVGTANRILHFILKFVPEKVKLHFIAKRWSRTYKDAF